MNQKRVKAKQKKKRFFGTTKGALISCMASLFVCAFMLTGTTFAWFTASVTNTGNRIEAGKLDIKVTQFIGDTFIETSQDEHGNTSIFNNDSWKPGDVKAAYFKIEADDVNANGINIDKVAYNVELMASALNQENTSESVADLSNYLVLSAQIQSTDFDRNIGNDVLIQAAGENVGIKSYSSGLYLVQPAEALEEATSGAEDKHTAYVRVIAYLPNFDQINENNLNNSDQGLIYKDKVNTDFSGARCSLTVDFNGYQSGLFSSNDLQIRKNADGTWVKINDTSDMNLYAFDEESLKAALTKDGENTVVLLKNIVMSDVAGGYVADKFAGILEGNGHTIWNLKGRLFNELSGTVQNINIRNAISEIPYSVVAGESAEYYNGIVAARTVVSEVKYAAIKNVDVSYSKVIGDGAYIGTIAGRVAYGTDTGDESDKCTGTGNGNGLLFGYSDTVE